MSEEVVEADAGERGDQGLSAESYADELHWIGYGISELFTENKPKILRVVEGCSNL